MGKALVVDSANQGSIARGEPTTIVVAGGVPYFVDSSNNITAIALGTDVVSIGATVDIPNLTEDTAPDLTADYIRTYDSSASAFKKVLLGRSGSGVLMGEVTSTGVTFIDFNGIPSWATEVNIFFEGVSKTGAGAAILVQLKINSGEVTSGYTGNQVQLANGNNVAVAAVTNGFAFYDNNVAYTASGVMNFYLSDSSNHTWICEGMSKNSTTVFSLAAGDVTLSSALTGIRITTTNGSDTFDAGSINVRYR